MSGRTGTCSVPNCGVSPCVGRGWCRKHYTRWQRTGDPLVARPRGTKPGQLCPNWKGDEIGYEGAHIRVRKTRGRAADHQCRRCPNQAAEWAYDHQDPNERVEEYRGHTLAFSVNPQRYMPLCISCHRTFDNAMRKVVA